MLKKELYGIFKNWMKNDVLSEDDLIRNMAYLVWMDNRTEENRNRLKKRIEEYKLW